MSAPWIGVLFAGCVWVVFWLPFFALDLFESVPGVEAGWINQHGGRAVILPNER